MNADSIEVVVPASGVRAWYDRAGRVVVHATDDGAHGKPWAALFVPLRRRGAAHGLAVAGALQTSFDAAALLRHARWRCLPGSSGSYVFTFERDEWPSDGAQVLLLLVSLCATGGEPAPPPPCDPAEPQHPPPGCEAALAAAVQALLQRASWGELRAGLIAQGPAPDEQPGGSVTFALASCNYPCDILDHMPDDDAARIGPADASLLALGRRIDAGGARAPSLLLLAGDQVYVDATAGLFDPKVADDKFRIAYERLFASRGAKEVLQRLGLDVEMTLDDHEISDNWEPSELARTPPGRLSNRDLGLRAYWTFQRGAAQVDITRPVWRARSHRGLEFFLADTRCERQARSAADFRHKAIMGPQQQKALQDWLIDPELDGRPRFVVTPSLLLPRRLSVANDGATALHSDAWEGYPSSLHALLAWVCDHTVRDLVFLSGDEHVGIDALVTVHNVATGAVTSLRSIHTPALYSPYPFANSQPADFAARESFEFRSGASGPYTCTVSAHFAPRGDGVTLLHSHHDGKGWQLDIERIG